MGQENVTVAVTRTDQGAAGGSTDHDHGRRLNSVGTHTLDGAACDTSREGARRVSPVGPYQRHGLVEIKLSGNYFYTPQACLKRSP